MIINSIGIRNFKSFGNNVQQIDFSKEGQLILLTGQNGNGKSSLLESIDFVLYGIVRGKNSKRVPLKILPNRTNGNLETLIDFVNYRDERIFIRRKLEPTSFEITVDDVPYTEKFKKMPQSDRADVS